ncbi:flagellar hook-associated protein FlgK [Leeia oryzae]|uniref:flagellar hook-associated protein FlgK n=1 Tax=Leeia oryzae TaxID=356662 RepID=UPI00037B2B28|nr:flagellar hook-associated protein FlgK [Leeia oryzae]
MSLYSIGLSALNAAQMGLATTGHNITNASSETYHRQEIAQLPQTPQLTGAGFVGNGTVVVNIDRAYNSFMDQQILEVGGKASYYATYREQIGQIDNLLSDTTSGLSSGIQSFFSALQQVSSTPANVSARQSMLSASQAMVARFQTMDSRLADLYNGADQQIGSSITELNSLAKQVANLNGQIITAESVSGVKQANDLHDQRDALIAKINDIAKVTVSVDSSGYYNVMIGNGQSLVVGTNSNDLSVQRSAEDPQRSDIYFDNGIAKTLVSPTSLTGGSLGALLEFRDVTVTQTRNELGREAMTLANSFNAQHELGQDLTGAIGKQFFDVATPTVYSNANNTSASVMSASISNYGALQASDYRVSFTAPGVYSVTRLSDNTVFSGSPGTVDGVTLSFSAAAAAGDSFYMQPTKTGAGDIKQLVNSTAEVAAALPLRTQSGSANTGVASLTLDNLTTTTGIPAYGSTTPMRTLTYSGGTFTSSNAGDTLSLSGNTLTVNLASGGSLSLTLTGTPAAGDTFDINRNNSGIADSRNANLLGKLVTANLMNNGTTTVLGSYAQMVSQVGNAANELNVMGTAQDTLLSNVKATQQSFSGVNLDEEAAKLVQFQQAYQAAARILSTSQKLMDDIFSLMS